MQLAGDSLAVTADDSLRDRDRYFRCFRSVLALLFLAVAFFRDDGNISR